MVGPLLCRISKPFRLEVRSCKPPPAKNWQRKLVFIGTRPMLRRHICRLHAAVGSAQTMQLDPYTLRRGGPSHGWHEWRGPHLPRRRNLRALKGVGPRIASPSPSPTFLGPIRPSRCGFAAVGAISSSQASSNQGPIIHPGHNVRVVRFFEGLAGEADASRSDMPQKALANRP